MVKIMCPVCKSNIEDKVLKNDYECTNCKAKLNISKKFKRLLIITPAISAFIFPLVGSILAQHLIPDRQGGITYIIAPITAGLFAGSISFLLMLLYPHKLSKAQ
ncbi:hypothetical protein JHL18_21710 [Clostridium sp. YIM B02505]|uniref:Uncharacterized protein n=1 Tax=Clostridium yunnanense TaxID=2800325 RepID=A0ABS1EV58_9CLOT|nr:hypothetical protein [Clostridium yunnanense]MBK1813242.1 hypothetical protein [Clostridium yunnanense]